MRISRKWIFLLIILGLPSITFSKQSEVTDFTDDIEVIQNTRKAMQRILAFVKSKPEIFPAQRLNEKRLTSREQRQTIWRTWQTFLDRLLVLDDIGKRYETLYRELQDKESKQDAFRVSYAAFLIQYRYALEFITLMENDPAMHTMLNEAVPELGLKAGAYKEIKFRFLNVIRGAEFARLDVLYKLFGEDNQLRLTPGIEEDRLAIWKQGEDNGPKQTAKNALKIIHDTGFTVWFPLQKGVSEWMGDVKIMRPKHYLISKEQIEEMQFLLQPGDILLERREWYLSNVGLPGYWPHAALYIGTPDERKAYFTDKEVADRYADDNGSVDSFLKKNYPEAYLKSLEPQEENHQPRIIEAISEGVSFTTLEHSVDADSVVILRPRLSKLEKAIAIERAFHFSGRPYDFNFDFLTDAAMVCTEVVSKSYEPNQNYKGLTFPLQEVVGRKVTTANDIAKMFEEEYGKPGQQLDFIAFYDGHEWDNKAIKSDVDSFRKSWKRPKWFIWVQDSPMVGVQD
jgi:hypothetical protein